jgi:hypothetical protein
VHWRRPYGKFFIDINTIADGVKRSDIADDVRFLWGYSLELYSRSAAFTMADGGRARIRMQYWFSDLSEYQAMVDTFGTPNPDTPSSVERRRSRFAYLYLGLYSLEPQDGWEPGWVDEIRRLARRLYERGDS